MLGDEGGEGREEGEKVRDEEGKGGRGKEKGGKEEKEGRVGARFTRRKHAGVDTIN